jgi:hypothetical protein
MVDGCPDNDARRCTPASRTYRSREGKPTIHEPLVAYLRAQRIDCVDAAEAFRRATPAITTREWLAAGRH